MARPAKFEEVRFQCWVSEDENGLAEVGRAKSNGRNEVPVPSDRAHATGQQRRCWGESCARENEVLDEARQRNRVAPARSPPRARPQWLPSRRAGVAGARRSLLPHDRAPDSPPACTLRSRSSPARTLVPRPIEEIDF